MASMRLRLGLGLLFLSTWLLMGCYGQTTPQTGPRGTVRFTSNQSNAVLEIDDYRIGPIGMFEKTGVLLKPGEHRIVVYREGFFKEYKLIEVNTDVLQVIDVSLTPIPD